MTDYAFPPPTTPSVAIAGSNARFPIRRVICVGRNYAAHAREMGSDPDREPPFFFMKPADAVVAAEGVLPYPGATNELHYEVELVVALKEGGADIAAENALDLVWGYGVGLDLPAAIYRRKPRKPAGRGIFPRVLTTRRHAALWRRPAPSATRTRPASSSK